MQRKMMAVVTGLFILVIAECSALQFQPDFWKDYVSALQDLNKYALFLNGHLKTIEMPDKSLLNTQGVQAGLQVLETYINTDYKDKTVVKREIDKAIKANIMLASVESDLSLATVMVLVKGKITTEDKTTIMSRYSKVKEAVEKLNSDSNSYVSKLVELLQ